MPGDEPRRSGRATKGQHKTLDETAEPKTKKTAKAKTSKKAPQAEPAPDEEDGEGEDTIRCVCGDNTDDEAGRKFICCDACEVWQHNVCMGVSLDDSQQPEHYFCEQCRPEEHKELLDAMANGEKPWEERQKATKGKKKGVKRGRRSTKGAQASDAHSDTQEAAAEATPDVAEATDVEEGGVKRKFEEDSSAAAPANGAAVPKSGRAEKKRKSNIKADPVEESEAEVLDISQLPKERQAAANAMAKTIKTSIDSKVKAGSFKVPDGTTSDSLSKQLASLIEHDLYQAYPGKERFSEYKGQFLTINANIKTNPALSDRVLKKTLTPAELAVMSSQDMASEELQREREKMKEEADKQAVMIREDDKPRVRRTHKGEEYVDEDTSANVDSIYPLKPVRRRESEVEPVAAGSPVSRTQGSPEAPSGADTEANRRRSSSNFDIANVWAKTSTSPNLKRSSKQFQSSNGASAAASNGSATRKTTGDADIDRLLADDDEEDDYSPADLKTSDSNLVWRGDIYQDQVARCSASGRFVAGNDFSRYMPWANFLPKQFEIDGRIERTRADTYLCGLQWSKRSDVTVLALTPRDAPDSFDTIFNYFHTRERYAVVAKKYGCSELVKDIYLTPIDKGATAPPHVELLDYCALPSPAPERILLATFVVNKPASWTAPEGADPSSSSVLAHRASFSGGPAQSPLNPSGPAFSPLVPSDQSAQQLAPNPYAASPVPQGQIDPSVREALGPYMDCAVAQQILAATGGKVSPVELGNMRAIFDRYPNCREDLAAFSNVLNQGSV